MKIYRKKLKENLKTRKQYYNIEKEVEALKGKLKEAEEELAARQISATEAENNK